MLSARFQTRRSDVRPDGHTGAQTDTTVQRGVSVEETFVPDVDELPRPDGFGEEVSTSSQTNEVIATYEVPAGTLAKVSEASLSIEGNGQAFIAVNGVRYGPYTGAADVSVPLDDTVLTAGYQIKAVHQSTDGNSTTTQAQVVVEEV